MVVTDCEYDPVKDLRPVDEFGYIDLRSALVNSTVPSNLPDSDADYNGIEDPASILGKPKDVFEALAMENAINGYKPDDAVDSQ